MEIELKEVIEKLEAHVSKIGKIKGINRIPFELRLSGDEASLILSALKGEEWVKVEDDTPRDYETVLVLLENGEVFRAQFIDDIGGLPPFQSIYFKLNKGVNVTHWKSLSEPKI